MPSWSTVRKERISGSTKGPPSQEFSDQFGRFPHAKLPFGEVEGEVKKSKIQKKKKKHEKCSLSIQIILPLLLCSLSFVIK